MPKMRRLLEHARPHSFGKQVLMMLLRNISILCAAFKGSP